MVATCESITFVETMNIVDGGRWKETTNEEINSLKNIHTWELKLLPKGRKFVSSKWVFQIKRKANREIDKFKARLMPRGFT
jgi:hypothetical protein